MLYVAVVVIAFILLPICYKWRIMAKSLLYIECIFATVVIFIISKTVSIWIIFFTFCFFYPAFYCDSGAQLIFGLITLGINILGIIPVVYSLPMNFLHFLTSLSMLMGFFAFSASFGMLIVYISEMHSRLHVTNEENIKLLDGMHEGLLIM